MSVSHQRVVGTDSVRCRGCGREVWNRSRMPLVTAHRRPLEETPREMSECDDWRRNQVFADCENVPEWVTEAFTESNWQSGKLICSCGSPIGSYDFVSGRHCACGSSELPPVRLNVKKIDLFVESISNCDQMESEL